MLPPPQPKSKKRNAGADIVTAAPARARTTEPDAGAAAPARKRRQEPTLAARALRLLARREYTRAELERKLGPHVEDPALLQSLLDDFTARGWLSETRAVEQLVRAKRGRFGTARIRQALIDKGAPQHLIAPALENLKESELETARAVWKRKFRAPPSDTAERAKHVRFLQSRGFSLDVAMRVVRSAVDAEAD